jgi:signal peptidase complex subunit 1
LFRKTVKEELPPGYWTTFILFIRANSPDLIMDELRNIVLNLGTIDFEGQKLAQKLSLGVLVITSALSFVVGLLTQNIEVTVYGLGAAIVLAELLVIVPLPAYNKHGLEWKNPWRQ